MRFMDKSRFLFRITQAPTADVKQKPVKGGKPSESPVDIIQALDPAPEGATIYRAIAAIKEVNRNRWYKLNVAGITIQEYAKNPVIMLNHDYNRFPVGRAVKAYFANNKSELIIEFILSQTNPDAIQAASLIEEGILRAVSVGLHVLKTSQEGGDEVPTLEITELMELSLVAIGADSDALLQGGESEISQAMNDDDESNGVVDDIVEIKARLDSAEAAILAVAGTPKDDEPSEIKLSPELEKQINQAFNLDVTEGAE